MVLKDAYFAHTGFLLQCFQSVREKINAKFFALKGNLGQDIPKEKLLVRIKWNFDISQPATH